MDILSKLFGSSKKRDKSYVRTWAVERENELRFFDETSLNNLFASLMYGLSCFGKDNPNTKIPSQLMAANEQFSGDKTLFEIGCYMYFRLDIWLFQNAPNRREEISTFIMHEFLNLFVRTLNTKNIATIFNQRLSGFGKLAQNGADVEKYHHHLYQLIIRTKYNRYPKAYDFDNAQLKNTELDEVIWMKMELTIWEGNMLPGAIESLKNYCDLTK